MHNRKLRFLLAGTLAAAMSVSSLTPAFASEPAAKTESKDSAEKAADEKEESASDTAAGSDSLAKLKKVFEELRAKKAELEEQLTSLTEENASLSESAKTAEAETETVKKSLEEAQEELKSLKDDLAAALDEVLSVKEDLAAAQEDAATTKGDLEAVQAENASTKDELAAAQADADSAKAETESVKASLEEIVAMAEAQKEEFLEEIAGLKSEAEELISINEALAEANSAYEEETAALEASNNEASSYIESLVADLASLTEEKEDADSLIDTLQEDLEALTAENNDLSSLKDSLQEKFDSLTEENKALSEAKDAIQESLDNLTEEKEELESDAASLKETISELKLRLDPDQIADAASAMFTDDGLVFTDSIAIRIVQEALKSAGHDVDVDGIIGEHTKEAIDAFAREHNIKADGKITQTLVKAMINAGLITDTRLMAQGDDAYENWLSYASLAERPDMYLTTKMKLSGTVLQGAAPTEDEYGWLRIAVEGDKNQPLFVSFDQHAVGTDIEEGSEVTIEGRGFGTMSYTSASHSQVDVPWVLADKISK